MGMGVIRQLAARKKDLHPVQKGGLTRLCTYVCCPVRCPTDKEAGTGPVAALSRTNARMTRCNRITHDIDLETLFIGNAIYCFTRLAKRELISSASSNGGGGSSRTYALNYRRIAWDKHLRNKVTNVFTISSSLSLAVWPWALRWDSSCSSLASIRPSQYL